MGIYWYTGGPEMLAKGERAQRQLGAIKTLGGSVGNFAKRYYDYAKEGRDLRAGLELDEARLGEGAGKVLQETETPASLAPPPESAPLAVDPPDPTVDLDGETGFVASGQSRSLGPSTEGPMDYVRDATGTLTTVARKLLAPWGVMDDPEREALQRKRAGIQGALERKKARDKAINELIPVVEDPARMAGSAHAGIPTMKRKADASRSPTEAALAMAAAAGNKEAMEALRLMQRNRLDLKDAGRDPNAEVKQDYTDVMSRTATLPDGTTVEIPASDAGVLVPYAEQARRAWLKSPAGKAYVAANPDAKNIPVSVGPPVKKRSYVPPSGGGGSRGEESPSFTRQPPRPPRSSGGSSGGSRGRPSGLSEDWIEETLADTVKDERTGEVHNPGEKMWRLQLPNGKMRIRFENGTSIELDQSKLGYTGSDELPAAPTEAPPTTVPTTVPRATVPSTTRPSTTAPVTTVPSTTTPPTTMTPSTAAGVPTTLSERLQLPRRSPIVAGPGERGRRSGVVLTD